MTGESEKETLTAQRRYERCLQYLNEAIDFTLKKVKRGNGRKLNSWLEWRNQGGYKEEEAIM